VRQSDFGWNESELLDEDINQAIIASLMGPGGRENENYATNYSGGASMVEGAGDEGELKLLKEVMKMSELDYLKDAGCLNLNAIKKKGNKEVEDDIDNLFGPDIPTK
jgi:hypothetical protein